MSEQTIKDAVYTRLKFNCDGAYSLLNTGLYPFKGGSQHQTSLLSKTHYKGLLLFVTQRAGNRYYNRVMVQLPIRMES